MMTAKCHHRLDSLDTWLIGDRPALWRLNDIKRLKIA
jgi:hypothetical protein